MTLILLAVGAVFLAAVGALAVLSVRDGRRRRSTGSVTAGPVEGGAALRLTSSGPDLGAVSPRRYLDDTA